MFFAHFDHVTQITPPHDMQPNANCPWFPLISRLDNLAISIKFLLISRLDNLAISIKRKYYSTKINTCHGDSAKLWKTLKELLPNTNQVVLSTQLKMKMVSVVLNQIKVIANSFNQFILC